jgi:hypothetical protein
MDEVMVAIPGRVTVHCWSNVALSVDYLLIFPTAEEQAKCKKDELCNPQSQQ